MIMKKKKNVMKTLKLWPPQLYQAAEKSFDFDKMFINEGLRMVQCEFLNRRKAKDDKGCSCYLL